MKKPSGLNTIPDASHVSAGVRALNPQLFGFEVTTGQPGGKELRFEKKLRGAKQPNKTEQRFLDLCAAKVRRGEIDSFRYEGVTLKWGKDPNGGRVMRYTPDVTITKDGRTHTLIEVKGKKIWDRDLVRFRGCRAEWPEYQFEMWQEISGVFTRIE